MKILMVVLAFFLLSALPCVAQRELRIELVRAELSQNNKELVIQVNIVDPAKDGDTKKPGIQPLVVYSYGPATWATAEDKDTPNEPVGLFKARVGREVRAIILQELRKLGGKQNIKNDLLTIEAPPPS